MKATPISYSYNFAVLRLPNGEIIEGEVTRYSLPSNDNIEVIIDGITYFTNSVNVCLIER